MNAKDYLQSIRDMRFYIEDIKRERSEILSNMILIKSTSDYSDRVQSSPQKDKLELQVIKATEKMEKLDKILRQKVIEYQSRHSEARAKIRQLPEGQCRRFLLDYYIEGRDWDSIMSEYGFKEISSPYHLQARALKLYDKKFKHEHCMDNIKCDKV